MKNISKIFIHLFILDIYIVSIYSYDYVQFLSNNNDINEILHENLIERIERAIEHDSTIIYDGSGSITIELSTYTTTIPVILQSTTSTIEMINQSTIQLTTEQTSLLVTTATSMTSVTMNTTAITTSITSISPLSCNANTEVQLSNYTCISKADAQKLAFNILRSNSTNSTVVANALSLYISSITNSNTTLDSTYTLTIGEIDTYLSTLNNINLTINNNNSILIAQQPNQGGNVFVLGASFTSGIGGEVVKSTNEDNLIGLPLSASAIISNESLTGVTSLNMLIIGKPSAFTDIDNSSNKTLASAIIMASLRSNTTDLRPMNISLYFQVLDEYKPNVSAKYLCSYYDTNNLRWNESGCIEPQYNSEFDRYECSCNHLTSFALLWLPNVPLTSYLNAQDIASLVFQSISIVCFLLIIIHAIVIRIRDPLMSLQAYNLLSLISCGSTTILFIFYIALGMTVYTKTSSQNESQCFLSSSVLMFFVYFFLIFMFCAKTSVGYFNYLRFVHLFPQPSHRKLFIMLIISFFISILCVAFAIGFNSNPSYKITELYPYKLCWFTRNVIYYFVTIPAGLFILINIIIFILVAKCIINHVQNATSPHQSYERMKRCVLVLLSSSITQGIGWLFGAFITIVSPTAGEVLGWIFVIFNGLEGFWLIVLYLILRLQHIDEQKRCKTISELKTSKSAIYHEYKNLSIKINRNKNDVDKRETEINYRNIQKVTSHLFDDLDDLKSINWSINTDITTSYC